MTRRTRGREIALQVLYQLEQNPGVDPAEVRRFIERRLREPRLREFAEELVAGVRAHQPRLDTLIVRVAENWRLDRMAAIDRNILRLGAFEMLFCPEVPTKVAINEALELAKRYSTAQSSRFVNGILDRLQSADAVEPPAVEPSEPPPAGEADSAGPREDDRPLPGADLHVHTIHSDGACSPGEVVRAAATVGLSALAITDHDTLSALAVARPEADRLGIELVAGVELTAERDGREVHVLGHFVRPDDPALSAASSALRAARADRLRAMVERLAALGLSIDLAAISRAFPRATLGRRHLADWLVRTGQEADRRRAFARYLGDGGPADVPKPRLPWAVAVALIRGAGGVAGLAHPPYDLRERDLHDYADGGLGSIEVAGPGIDARCGRRWRDWAEALGLVPIAGSDFHAPDRPGRWVGSIATPAADFERLRGARPSPPIGLAPD